MQPLSGVRVLDLTHALAGPFCTYHLGLFGAEVVKVEPPAHGDDFRGFAPDAFDAVNGGKKSLTLDLKKPEAVALLIEIAPSFDVVIENFRPGVARTFGIDWDRLHAANPKLIYCSISGFGSGGPRAAWPAVEWSVQAATGLSAMYLTDGDDPRHLGFGMLDVFAGSTALTAILAAVLEVRRTGEGRMLEVTMSDAALTLVSPGLAGHLHGTRTGSMPQRPLVGRFRARDRRLFVMAAHQRWFETVSRVLGAPFLADDPRFATPEDRDANRDALLDAFETRLSERDAREWQDELLAAGVPSSVVQTLAEVVRDGMYEGSGMIQQVWSDARGKAHDVAGATFSGRTVSSGPGTVPALGADTDAVLGTLGVDADRLASLRAANAI